MSAELVVGLLDSGAEAALSVHLRASRAFVDETRPGPYGHATAIARIILRHAPGAAVVHAQVFGARQRTTPELVAAVTGRAGDATTQAAAAADVSVEDVEKQQGLWWYLLFAGLLLLAAEMLVSNRLSRQERFL